MISYEALTLVFCLVGFTGLAAAGLSAAFLIGRYGGQRGKAPKH